ncbi:YetF domain-containing protein [Caldilinea sp.]|uniref:DUF421 domain-containing protein n=1 Tax=Caldilinea sp. TaxID=2293560 RepID=UPI002CE87877|nr:DUF421 domain-containing protein [Caldilinea sp.]
MEPVTPFDWQRLFIGNEPPLFFLEIIFRVIMFHAFTVVALRYMGKRGQRQMSPFEFVLIIALGSATGDSMFYPEVPILYAWLVVLVVVLLDRLLADLQMRSHKVNTFLEGNPRLLVREGKILDENLYKERLRREELLGLLREQEIANTGEVQYVFLERTGSLGLFRSSNAEQYAGVSTYPDDSKE